MFRFVKVKRSQSGDWERELKDYLDYKHSSARFYDLGEEPACVLHHYEKFPPDRIAEVI